jgi:exopolysaccharide production protein ExoZ
LTNLVFPKHRQLRQIEGLQVWRAIAVLLVAWLHIDQVVRLDQVVHLSQTATVNLVRACNLGMFGVDIFFVISGFILGSTALRAATGEPRAESIDFIARRILRIFPIYWIVILFPLFRSFRLHKLTGYNFLDYWFLLPGISYPETQLIIGIGWTLIFEMVFYYVMTIFMRLSLRHAVRNAMAALILLVATGIIVDIRRPVLIILMNPILLEFVLGNLTALAFNTFGKHRTAGIGILVGGVIVTCVLTYRITYDAAIEHDILLGVNALSRVATWGIAAWLLVSGVVFWGPQVRSRVGKTLVTLGNGSYSIYLTSAVSIEMVIRFMARMPMAPAIRGYVLLQDGIDLILVVLIGMVFHWMIERPLGKQLNGAYSSLVKRRSARAFHKVVAT